MRSTEAYAKINLGLVVGPVRPDGKHEVATVLERIGLSDTIEVEPGRGREVSVEGFEDSIVHAALVALRGATGTQNGWRVRVDKRIPVAAGLGGGSADAAAALRLANEAGGSPLGGDTLHELAATIGADVPFFLSDGPQLATGDGSVLRPASIPRDIPVVVVLPHGETKHSTAAVYARFDDRVGASGFDGRRDAMLSALEHVSSVADLASLPGNDLASSPIAGELLRLGACRADVSGAGPAVYGLFEDERTAARAASELQSYGRTWLTCTVDGR